MTAPGYPREMRTIGSLIDGGYTMHARCPEHGWRGIDLQVLAERYGCDASYIVSESPIRIRCAVCGLRLRYQIAPPPWKPPL